MCRGFFKKIITIRNNREMIILCYSYIKGYRVGITNNDVDIYLIGKNFTIKWKNRLQKQCVHV